MSIYICHVYFFKNVITTYWTIGVFWNIVWSCSLIVFCILLFYYVCTYYDAIFRPFSSLVPVCCSHQPSLFLSIESSSDLSMTCSGEVNKCEVAICVAMAYKHGHRRPQHSTTITNSIMITIPLIIQTWTQLHNNSCSFLWFMFLSFSLITMITHFLTTAFILTWILLYVLELFSCKFMNLQ